MISGFSLSQMAIDRLIAVRFPLAARRLCTASRAKITIGITYTVSMVVNLHIFFIYKYTTKGK
jgi:hypothetical protein